MINIPSEVVTLFKRDDVRKNFHVTFPNGEHTDLNNENVISESVKFTESICSQQSFRFGLTEASEITFTAVNIPNIRGVKIECAIEIDISELGDTWINSHLPDSAVSFLTPQCLSTGYYRVPYGRFKVDTCPRNHEAMFQREITAYSTRFSDSENLNGFEQAKLNSFMPQAQTYDPMVKPLVFSIFANENTDLLQTVGYTETAMQWYAPGGVQPSSETVLSLKDGDGNTVSMSVVTSFLQTQTITVTALKSNLYRITRAADFPDITDQVTAMLEDKNIDANASGYESLEDIAIEAIGGLNQPFERVQFQYPNGSTIVNAVVNVPIPNGTNLMYGYRPNYHSAQFCKPTRTAVYFDNVEEAVITHPSASYYELTDTAASELDGMTLSFNNTLKTNAKINGTVMPVYSFANAFSFADIVTSYLELQCKFGAPSRSGGVEIVSLDSSAPVAIPASDYSQFWYDESTISPIGEIQFAYKDAKKQKQDAYIKISGGASVYDLSDNAILENTIWTVTKAEAAAGATIKTKMRDFIQRTFTPNLPDMSFVPVDLSMRGLPYITRGDAVTLTTEGDDTVHSFIMVQTITGIQYLFTDAESMNGDVLEVAA